MKKLTLALLMMSVPTLGLAANPGSPGPDTAQTGLVTPVATSLHAQSLKGPVKDEKKAPALEKTPAKKSLKKFRLSNTDLPKKRR
jgi:hypothetical protein